MKNFITNIAWFIAKLITPIGVSVGAAQIIAYVLMCVAAASFALFLFVKVSSCFHKTPKIDQATIEKINHANEVERKAELQKIVEENADTISTVDGRTKLVNVATEDRSAEFAARVADANAKVQQAKAQKGDVTEQELLELIEGK